MLQGRKRDRKREKKGIKKWEHGFPQCICSPEAAFEILTLRQFPLDAFAEWHYRRCGYECIVRSRTCARVRFTNTAHPSFLCSFGFWRFIRGKWPSRTALVSCLFLRTTHREKSIVSLSLPPLFLSLSFSTPLCPYVLLFLLGRLFQAEPAFFSTLLAPEENAFAHTCATPLRSRVAFCIILYSTKADSFLDAFRTLSGRSFYGKRRKWQASEPEKRK